MDKFIRTEVSNRLEKLHMEQFPIDPKDLTPLLEQVENEVCSLYRMWKSTKSTCKQLREANSKSSIARQDFYEASLGLDPYVDMEKLDQFISLNIKALMSASKSDPIFYACYMQRVVLLINTNHYTAAENCWKFLPQQPEAHNYELYRNYLGLLVQIKMRDCDKIEESKRVFQEVTENFRVGDGYSLCYCDLCTASAIYDKLFKDYSEFSIQGLFTEADEALNETRRLEDLNRAYTDSVNDIITTVEEYSRENLSENERDFDIDSNDEETTPEEAGDVQDDEEESVEGQKPEPETQPKIEDIDLNGSKLNFAFGNVDIVQFPFGRGMKATANISKGEHILMEKSYCEMLPASALNERCNRCRTKITFEYIVPCDECSEVIYCSEECRVEDWDNFSHESECGLIAFFQSRSQFYTLRHLGLYTPQGILDRLDEFNDKHEEYGIAELMKDESMRQARNSYEIANYDATTNFWRAFNTLTAPFDITRDYTNNIISAIESTFMALESIDDELFLSLPSSQLYRLISYSFCTILRFIVNNFSTEYGGTSICLVGSMFNHNCQSNAFWKFDNGVLIVRALRDIKEGEQITVDYGTSKEMSFEKRWNKIRNYYFQCNCECCLADYNTVPCVRCHDCQGPVPIPIGALLAVERHGDVTDRKFYCLKCNRLEPKAVGDMKRLRSLWFDLKNASTTLPLITVDEVKTSLFETIKKIIFEAYQLVHPLSYFWLNFVYKLANAYYTMGLVKEAIELGGSHTDFVMKSKNMSNLWQLLVLQEYTFEEEDDEGDLIAPKLKSDLLPAEYMLNVQHLLFWSQLYFENIDKLNNVQIEQMNRFYSRRVQLLEKCLKALPGKIDESVDDKQLFTVKAGEKEEKFLKHLKNVTEKEVEYLKGD